MKVVYLALSLSERAYRWLRRLGLCATPVFTEGLPAVPDRRILEVKELLLPGEVANILRISKTQVYYLEKIGVLEGVRVSSNCLRIKAASVRRIIDGEGERG